MSEIVKMPRLSDTMEEGVLVKWHKQVGDKIEEGDLLAEIETDKATMEFESFQSGYILRIDTQEGETVKVDASICVLGEQNEKIENTPISSSEAATIESEADELKIDQPQTNAIPTETIIDGAEMVTMPKLSDTMEDGTLVKWHKEIGDKVEEGDLLAEIETDKATMEFESFQSGYLLHKGIPEGESTKVDGMIAILGTDKNADISAFLQQRSNATKTVPINNTTKTLTEKSETYTSTKSAHIKASPLAKKMAADLKLNLKEIQGTGEGGRIIKRDVEGHTPTQNSKISLSNKPISTDKDAIKPLSQMRKTIAKRLSESKFSAPHYYISVDVNVKQLKAAREVLNANRSSRISYNDLVIKAVSKSLELHKDVNSSWGKNEVIEHGGIHIGVAVAIDEGLIVPTLFNANQKNLTQINTEIKTLAQKAKTKKLTPQEIEGSTFTISNLGMFGIQSFTSIINQPNTAILSVGAILESPVVERGKVVVGNLMNLTLACDHRVVDGATASAFLKNVQENLEEPLNMLA